MSIRVWHSCCSIRVDAYSELQIMKKLNHKLKRILSGLANQHAGEFLSMHDKMKVLSCGAEARVRPTTAAPQVPRRPVSKRIAFISDGNGLGTPLDYAIDASLRQGAQIDLLLHGVTDMASISALENQVREAGLDCQCIQLGVNAVDSIAEYIGNHPSLVFLVAIPDDSAVRVLIEEVIPKRGSRLLVPLVLIEDQALSRPHKQSAA